LLTGNQIKYIKKSEQIGVGKKYLIVTFGCQMNEHDSEVMAAILNDLGYVQAAVPEKADLIIINTCAVRQKPEDKVASLLGKLTKLKEENKSLIIAVAGCMTQQEDLACYIKERFQHVDLIIGTHALPRLPSLIMQTMEKKGTIVDIVEDYSSREGLPVFHSNNYKAWLPIIYGCNNFCSYCIVPFVRGRERSRSVNEIIKESQILTDHGFIEITLLGQNVNSYGHDLTENIRFSDLLLKLNRIDNLERIRFMTSHPKDLSDRLIDVVSRGDKVCEHFHLPVQSGSNRILEKMNRHYTREYYLALVKKIKDRIPGVSITTDFIVGFPGEKEKDFSETLDLIEEARFDNAFSFLYSPRKNTAAALMSDQVNQEIKESRLQRLNEVQHKISKENNACLINQVVEVLTEGSSKNDSNIQTGRTRTNKLVHFKSKDIPAGKLIPILITEARTWSLLGKIEGE
jgi:tRNA-2-methylthio-N6-dimethylallyladenosine synthase